MTLSKTLVFYPTQGFTPAFKTLVHDALGDFKPEAIEHTASYVRLLGVNVSEAQADALRSRASETACDVFCVANDLKFADIEALFFDMDSTLVNSETLDEMAAIYGLGEACAKITADTMAGIIKDYPASLRARVALLKGLPAKAIETVWENMRPNPGVESWIAFCREKGKKTYVVSSGFTVLASRLADCLQMTGYHTNEIEIEGDTLTGRFTGAVTGMNGAPIMDGAGKKEFVRQTCEELRISPARVLCAGDGSNDVAMVAFAGVGVGFRPKKVLRSHCAVAIDFAGMDALKSVFSDAEERSPGLPEAIF